MTMYLDLVILLNFLVDLLLLLGANRLSGYPPRILPCVCAAVLGGIYAGVCLLPELRFLGNTLWRIIFLSIMSVMAFGFDQSALRRAVLFIFLSMALGGIAMGLSRNNFVNLLLAAGGIFVICVVGFRGKIAGQQFVPVELTLRGQSHHLTALMDTGNTLKDPVTGQQILIVGADVAHRIMGLTDQQLSDPISTVASGGVPGLRLIPYRAVGQPYGMLLAYRFDKVKIKGKSAGEIVAFAPNRIGSDGGYQALTGGIL